MDAGRWAPPETAPPPFWKGDDSLAVKAGVLCLVGLFLLMAPPSRASAYLLKTGKDGRAEQKSLYGAIFHESI
jgi:hypothetical protein